MIENGSDVHQGGDGPLMRAALNDSRIPMMELLVSHGADVNARWHGHFPIILPLRVIGSGISSGFLITAQIRTVATMVPDWRPFVSRHGSRLRHRLL